MKADSELQLVYYHHHHHHHHYYYYYHYWSIETRLIPAMQDPSHKAKALFAGF